MEENLNYQDQQPLGTAQPSNFNPKTMKPCKSCGQPIAKKAKVCPNCGAKNKKPLFKKPIFWILIVLVVIIIVAIASSGDSSDTTTVESISSSETAQTNASESDTYKPAGDEKILPGNVVTTDELKISYISCNTNYTDYSEFSEPEKGNKVVRAEFTFENISSSDISLDSFECYADGKKCEEFYGADDYASPTLESISSGRTFSSVIYFEVPESASEIELEYESDFWSNDKIVFVVK